MYNQDPELYWRLSDATGSTTAADAGRAGSTGDYVGSTAVRITGALSGTTDGAAQFNGTAGFVAGRNLVANPQTYSVEAWFNTTSTKGGRIIGFGNSRTVLSSTDDRHVFLQNNGVVVFGVSSGGQQTLSSSSGFNDGAWHHVVGAQSSSGMRLYLDGQQVGSNFVTTAQNYTGYRRVGGDRTWGSTNSYLTGAVDEAAVYSTELSPDVVRAHFVLGRGVVNAPPVASFTAATSELTATVDGSASSDPDGSIASYAWDFGDGGTATGATARHDYATDGTRTISLTVTDNSGGTNTTTQQVTVAASNHPPTAAFTTTTTDLTVSVDGSSSTDPENDISNYDWEFGDGGTASGPTARHTYLSAGVKTVSLTVTDATGRSNTVSQQVTVSAANIPPTASFTASAADLTISANGIASSDQDGTITGYRWTFGDGANGAGSTVSHSYAAAGTYTVTLTVTDDRGGTNSSAQPVTVTAPTALAKDLFGRTVSNGFGTADTGGPWTITGTAARFSVNGSSGHMQLASAGASLSARLGSVSVADIDTTVDIALEKVPTNKGAYLSLDQRRQADSSAYRAKVTVAGTGSVALQLFKVSSAGAETVLSTVTVVGLTYAANDVLRLRFQISGTNLKAKVFRATDAEPSTWTSVATDGTITDPGAIGLIASISSGATNFPIVVSYDNLTAIAPAL